MTNPAAFDPIGKVDPFWGSDTTALTPREGLAARWFLPKALTGNTHPGACWPFGPVSVGAYSGAYVTGYGQNDISSRGLPRRLFHEPCATGFTHFHPSGTGAIKHYYNYFRVVPLHHPGDDRHRHCALVDEEASPGYYAATLRERGIRAELTVTPRVALHRYRFPPGRTRCLAVDFASGGLLMAHTRTRPTRAAVQVDGPAFAGHVCMEGIVIYVAGRFGSADTRVRIFCEDARLAGGSYEVDDGARVPESFGILGEWEAGHPGGELRLAFSLNSVDEARQRLHRVSDASFDDLRAEAAQAWREHLSVIEVDAGGTAVDLFYSSLYHSLIKPCAWTGDNPFGASSGPLFVDLATLWDQYKTALPLILTFFPGTGSDLVRSLLGMAEYLGEFTNALLLNRQFKRFEKQARGLAHHVIADARIRHLPGIDWAHALHWMVRDLEKAGNRDFHSEGVARPYTHTLDLAGASFCTALLAHAERNMPVRDKVWNWASRWQKVYDAASGLLGASRYYEGGPWNYSFRLLHDMRARITLHGGEGPFLRDLERFFGFDQPPVQQPFDPDDDGAWAAFGTELHRFEGFNNEPDMETPYAFLYAGAHARTCEVIRAALAAQFRPGRGGLPGNNDSGGLTSSYVWNALGLFPVAGQPVMLVGSPSFSEAKLKLPQSELRITANCRSAEDIYVQQARWNGRWLERPYLTMREFLQGGTLEFTMQSQPGEWGSRVRPPSYTDPGQPAAHF